MLEIRNISKTYKTGDLVQKALNNVSLNLRDNEFVAILGPSGSGKTTLLNIIGGLDHYDSGDLIINGVSTKNYKDRDYDAYRNHSIGFVFQSYNLIPHQSILANVELALTISGVSKNDRRQRALEALDKVGLKEQAHKKPNQLSGGQMQRVAIARALVNNPDIVLADEPTGALDTKTSIQVMELLKEVAKDRLVVMVTHNPELADNYANRIVRLKDGEIIDDSNPYQVINNKETINKRIGKAKMSFFTALSLSFNNLLTKKGRTILTAFAGSIGIIGIALILSVSQGFQNYIDSIQRNTLSSYPLTINKESADFVSLVLSMKSDAEYEVEDGYVKEQNFMSNMFSSVNTNDLKSFKYYLEENYDDIKDDVTNVSYTYSITPIIYTIDSTDTLVKLNPNGMFSSMTSNSLSSYMTSAYSSYGFGVYSEMNSNEDIRNDYDVLAGRWPKEYNELIIVLSQKDSISDLLAYSLGLKDYSELRSLLTQTNDKNNEDHIMNVYSYDDLLNLDLRLINASNLYKYNGEYNIYEDMSNDGEYMKKQYDNALKLDVVGIVVPKEGSNTNALSPGVNYSKELTEYIIDNAYASSIVKKQLNNMDIDVFSGKSFDQKNEELKKTISMQDVLSIDEKMLSEAFKINTNNSLMNENITKIINEVVSNSLEDLSKQQADNYQELIQAFVNTLNNVINGYINSYSFYVPDDTNGTACPLGYVNDNPLLGCQLPNSDDEDYQNYHEVIGFSIDQETTKTIYVYKDNYKQYTNISDEFINEYRDNIISNDILQPSELRDIANRLFDEFINEARQNGTSLIPNIDTSDISNIDINELIQRIMNDEEFSKTIEQLAIKSIESYITNLTSQLISEISKSMFNNGDMANIFSIDVNKLSRAFKFNVNEEEFMRIMEASMNNNSISTASSNLTTLGYQDKNEPTSISFYFDSFESKENFMSWLNNYNENANQEQKINYADITGILMSSVKTIVDSVTYVLIAFVSISLIVSSIMIAVITLISVLERRKEIGILRAIGASKANVSSIFNAETFIIGLLSGLIGVGASYLLIIPINAIIHSLANSDFINAILPGKYALILVIISVLLTIFSGLIPAKQAAKQDPVIALRSE